MRLFNVGIQEGKVSFRHQSSVVENARRRSDYSIVVYVVCGFLTRTWCLVFVPASELVVPGLPHGVGIAPTNGIASSSEEDEEGTDEGQDQ